MIAAMNAPNAADQTLSAAPSAGRRTRLVRERSAVERFGLHAGEMYRVAYVSGGVHARRVSRSLLVFEGVAERRRWDGESTVCLDFVLPQGRGLSLLGSQLVDVRPAGLNERGQWVLIAPEVPARRHRQRRRRPDAA